MADLESVISGAVAAAKEPGGALESAGAADTANGDIAASTPPAETSVVEGTDGAPASDPGDPQPVKVPATDPAATAAAAAAAAAAREAETTDDFDKVPAKDATGRTNRIPHPRVKVMVESAVKRAVEPITAERDTLKTHNAEYVARLTGIAETERLLFEEPKAFVEVLKTLKDDKGQLLYAGLFGDGAQAAATAAPLGDIDFKQAPQPDGTDGGYTAEGLSKLLAWHGSEVAKRAAAQATKDVEARMTERYGPIERSFTEAQKRNQRAEQSTAQVRATVAEAQSWRGFKEHASEIQKRFIEDGAAAQKNGGKYKYASLRECYEDVIFEQLTADHQKVYDRVVAQLKAQPGSTSAGAAGGARPAAPAPQPGEDRLEGAIKRAMREAGM